MLPKYRVGEVLFFLYSLLSESWDRDWREEERGWKACKQRRALCWKSALYPGFRGRQSGEEMRGGELRRLPGQWGKAASENKWELTADANSSASYSWQWIQRLKQGKVVFIYICVCMYVYVYILFLKGFSYFQVLNYFRRCLYWRCHNNSKLHRDKSIIAYITGMPRGLL